MSKTTGSTDSLTTPSSYPDKQPGEIIYLKDHISTSADNTGSYISPAPPLARSRRIKSDLRDHFSFDEVRKKIDSELLTEAYNSIIDALDNEISLIERSNHFDEWKDYLQKIISKVTNLSVNNRKILGSILIAVKGKDIADFKREELVVLRESTYMLRQSRVTGNDSKKIIKQLITIGCDLVIPLSVDCISVDEEKRLKNLIKTLLKK